MGNSIELTIKVFLTKDIKSQECLEVLSNLIDKTLTKDKFYIDFHNENKYKNYNFDMMYPLEEDKIYKKENIYNFRLRCIDKNLISFLVSNLSNEYNEYLKVLTISKKMIPKKHIEKIYSVTPTILKFDEGYWKRHTSICEVEKRLKENIIKKYNSYYNTKIDENFELFSMITIKNQKPIKVNYKDISLLGDKFEITVFENETAQKIIYFSLFAGLGEMNARGFGFINYRWL